MALFDVVLGYDCNLACDYCTITEPMRARSLEPGRVVAGMREARRRGYDRVSFTGGEPTIRRDLLGLVRAAAELGFTEIKLQSNGLLYAQPANVGRLLEAGVTTFHVSIHTHLEGAYERMVRRAGTFASMRQGLVHLVDAGVDPTADVILESETHRRLPDALAWLADLGVRRADLWFVSLTDGNRDRLASMPRMTEVIPSVRAALEVAAARGVAVRSLHLPRCLLGELAHIAYDPAAERVRLLTPDDELDLSEAKLTPQVHVPACDGCPDRGVCRGVRPDYLERYGDSEVARARGLEPSIRPTRLPIAPGA